MAEPVTNALPARETLVDMNATTITPTDCELLRQYARHDSQRAFTEIVDRYQAMVLGTAYRRTGCLELARDLAQEVFATLARKASLLVGRASVGGWLHQATVYQSMRALQSESRRHSRHQALLVEAAEKPKGLGAPSGPERWAVLEESIDALPGTDREALVLHYYQDLSYSDMAQVLGTSEPAVRQRVSRALERLGSRLRERGVGGNAVALLLGAVALQSTLLPHSGLAQAAMAAAAAGAGSSAFLTLTAILSNATVKTAAAVVALAALPALWHFGSTPAGERGRDATAQASLPMPADAVVLASESAAPSAARDLRVRSSTAPVGGVPGTDAATITTAGSTSPRVATAPLDASPLRAVVPEPPLLASLPPASVPLSGPVPAAPGPEPPETSQAPEAPRSIIPPLASELPDDLAAIVDALPAELDPFGGLDAMAATLRRLEGVPAEAAKVYGRTLDELLKLSPVQSERVEAFLKRRFEDLNAAGIVGPVPIGSSERADKLRAARKPAVEALVGDLAQVAPETTPHSDTVRKVLSLADKAPIESTSAVEVPISLEAVASEPALQQLVTQPVSSLLR